MATTVGHGIITSSVLTAARSGAQALTFAPAASGVHRDQEPASRRASYDTSHLTTKAGIVNHISELRTARYGGRRACPPSCRNGARHAMRRETGAAGRNSALQSTDTKRLLPSLGPWLLSKELQCVAKYGRNANAHGSHFGNTAKTTVVSPEAPRELRTFSRRLVRAPGCNYATRSVCV